MSLYLRLGQVMQELSTRQRGDAVQADGRLEAVDGRLCGRHFDERATPYQHPDQLWLLRYTHRAMLVFDRASDDKTELLFQSGSMHRGSYLDLAQNGWIPYQ